MDGLFWTEESIEFPIKSRLASLPDLVPPSVAHCGPFETSNWVIHQRILAGSYPGDLDKAKAVSKIQGLLEAGVTTFICLQEREELSRFESYAPLIEGIIEADKDKYSRGAYIWHFPIPDMHIVETDVLLQFIEELTVKITEGGECAYIHCWGGHGRTGTVIGALLGRFYDLTPNQALQLTYQYHHQRKITRGIPSPQSYYQCKQVEDVVGLYFKKFSSVMSALVQQGVEKHGETANQDVKNAEVIEGKGEGGEAETNEMATGALSGREDGIEIATEAASGEGESRNAEGCGGEIESANGAASIGGLAISGVDTATRTQQERS